MMYVDVDLGRLLVLLVVVLAHVRRPRQGEEVRIRSAVSAYHRRPPGDDDAAQLVRAHAQRPRQGDEVPKARQVLA